MSGQRPTQRTLGESHSTRAIRRSIPFAQVIALFLLVVSTTWGQWLEKTIYLPDEFGGLIWPNCVAFDTVRNKVYFGGGEENLWDGGGTDVDYEVWIVVVDAVTLRRIAHIRVPDFVVGLCFNPREAKLYCSLYDMDQVGVVDCTTDSLVATIAVGHAPDSLCLAPDENKLYCAGRDDVTIIDCSADTVLSSMAVPDGPRQLTYASANHTVYCRGETEVTLIDALGDSIRGVLELYPRPYLTSGACWNPLESKYYCVKCTSDVDVGVNLFVVDGFSDSVLAQMPMPVGGLWFNPANNRVYGTNWDTIFAVDCTADTLVAAIPISGASYPVGQITGSPKSNRLYCVPQPSGDNWRGVLVADCIGDSFVTLLPSGVMPWAMGYDSRNDRLFTVNYETDDVTVVDCAGDSVLTTICVGFKAGYVVYASNEDKVYVGGESFEGIIAIDAATNRVVAEIPTGTLVTDMCYNPVLSKLYTVYPADDTVLAIDCRTDRVVARIGVGDRPMYLAFSPVGGSKVYCANTNRRYVSVIACTRDSVVTTVNLQGQAGEMLSNTREEKVYCKGDGVKVLDCRGDTLLRGRHMWGEALVYSPEENKAYFARFDTLSVVDGATDSISVNLPFADSLGTTTPYWSSGCYNTRNNKVYLSAYVFLTGRAFLVVDGISDTLLRFCWDPAGGVGMWRPMYNPMNNKVYLPYNGSGFVAVLDGATDSVLTTVAVSANPRGLAWSPIRNRIFVACYRGSSVSVIKDSLIPGVEESAPEASSSRFEATVVRASLWLAKTAGRAPQAASLLDISGRRVLDLKPGQNNVGGLSTGVYFVRTEVVGRTSLTKVIVAR